MSKSDWDDEDEYSSCGNQGSKFMAEYARMKAEQGVSNQFDRLVSAMEKADDMTKANMGLGMIAYFRQFHDLYKKIGDIPDPIYYLAVSQINDLAKVIANHALVMPDQVGWDETIRTAYMDYGSLRIWVTEYGLSWDPSGEKSFDAREKGIITEILNFLKS